MNKELRLDTRLAPVVEALKLNFVQHIGDVIDELAKELRFFFSRSDNCLLLAYLNLAKNSNLKFEHRLEGKINSRIKKFL